MSQEFMKKHCLNFNSPTTDSNIEKDSRYSFILHFCLCVFLFYLIYIYIHMGFPGGDSGKEFACQCRRGRRPVFNPWVWRIPWRRHGPHSSVLARRIPWTEEPVGLREITQSQTWLKQLSTHAYVHFTIRGSSQWFSSSLIHLTLYNLRRTFPYFIPEWKLGLQSKEATVSQSFMPKATVFLFACEFLLST